jgi:hypothetical protein
VLAPESAEEQLGRIGAAAPTHRGEDQSREIGVVEDLHSPVPPRDHLRHGDILRWGPSGMSLPEFSLLASRSG